MATRIPEAHKRMFQNKFVCKNCHRKIKADPRKIVENKVKCRNCGSKDFRKISRK